ncbi:HdeD family acid-resistance protein [Yinghuangia sp. YIM S10712]|uniref:HdeD family acid-resistance protein n=1 Tax=Yinghuangia sp. YIM S10712 TaxID=3436930 RepID=UPI003F53839D
MGRKSGAGPRHAGAAGPEATQGKGGFGFGFLVFLGIILIIGGIVGLVYVGLATITTMVLFAWLLLVGGIVGLFQAIQSRKEAGAFWLTVAVAALNIAAGVVLLRRPEVAAAALTLFVALLLLTAGLFRVVGGIASMSARMTWTIVVGVVDIGLGCLVLAEWPSSSRYVIGTFISLALLFDGLSMLSLGITGRRIVGMVRSADAATADPAAAPVRTDRDVEAESEELAGGAAWRNGPGEADQRRDPSTAEWIADKNATAPRKLFGRGGGKRGDRG